MFEIVLDSLCYKISNAAHVVLYPAIQMIFFFFWKISGKCLDLEHKCFCFHCMLWDFQCRWNTNYIKLFYSNVSMVSETITKRKGYEKSDFILHCF